MQNRPPTIGHDFRVRGKKMADILSRQYQSVFSSPKPTQPHNMRQTIVQVLQDIDFTQAEIQEALQEIKVASSPGPDGIPAFVLKIFAKELAYPIMKIW